MANIKSQKKRIEVGERNRVANAAFKSKMRKTIRDAEAAVAAGKLEDAKKLLVEATSLIDKSVKMGIQHGNTAARQKSHLSTKVNSLEKKPADKPAEAAK
ncbi:MAG: 30S ribosomal protein S20 [Bacilli bacterium]|nr:30S ribosomal protein S20 [Bacilli bacterium]